MAKWNKRIKNISQLNGGCTYIRCYINMIGQIGYSVFRLATNNEKRNTKNDMGDVKEKVCISVFGNSPYSGQKIYTRFTYIGDLLGHGIDCGTFPYSTRLLEMCKRDDLKEMHSFFYSRANVVRSFEEDLLDYQFERRMDEEFNRSMRESYDREMDEYYAGCEQEEHC